MEDTQILELVRLAQNGDREAFGELAREFQPSVFAIVLRRLRNRSEAYEVTQDVFIQAMRKLAQLRDAERFGPWLRRIAVRMSINRATRRPNEANAAPEVFSGVADVPETPLDRLLQNERAAEVWKGLRSLGDMDRQTLIAFYVDGHSLKEMSDSFSSPIGTIKRRLHTARNRLRGFLTDPATA